MYPNVSIIILNYNGYLDTIECLESMSCINYPNYHVIVVDNNSKDNSYEYLYDYIKEKDNNRITLLKTESNKGYSAGNNFGIQYALEKGTDYILILNNDTVFVEDIIYKLVNVAEINNDIGIIGPKVVNVHKQLDWPCARNNLDMKTIFFVYTFMGRAIFGKNNKLFAKHTYNFYNIDSLKKVYAIGGACMLIKSSVFKNIGLLDEKTFIGFEEFILSEKCKNNMVNIYTLPEAVLIHKGSQSLKKVKAFCTIEGDKSEYYFYKTYLKMSSFKLQIIKFVRIIEYLLLSFCDKEYLKSMKNFMCEYVLTTYSRDVRN